MATIVDNERCTGCAVCVEYCSLGLISIVDGKAVIADGCCNCKACIGACALKALSTGPGPAEYLVCGLCGVGCQIAPGLTGTCKRFTNVNGQTWRNRPLPVPERAPVDVEQL